jgi:hypothetical protein
MAPAVEALIAYVSVECPNSRFEFPSGKERAALKYETEMLSFELLYSEPERILRKMFGASIELCKV